MSGRRHRELRKAARHEIQASKAAVRDNLRARGGERFWAGFGLRELWKRLCPMSWLERYRFLVGRCLACGSGFRKKRWTHDCDAEACMYVVLDRLQRRRGHDFPVSG